MTENPYEGEPIIRDKRRVDPTTGELRATGATPGTDEVSGAGAPAGATDATQAAGDSELEAARAEILDLQDQLARAKAETYNTDQRFNAFVKRTRGESAAERTRGRVDVAEALVPVLDDIELARAHGELVGPFAAIAEKLEQILSSRFEVERFGAEGEEFDPTLHEALMHADDPAATTTTVQRVLQPGYRAGERIVRPARVAVVGPE
ncbi:GrpE protein [Beutenbergia cavernae DSM 12333]|uniref:Protein GrpE n=1 Tax=Beutenbergia cavernae (strain ATCC BAA-8 / DSM 12333 / CCUG 43141 / JCM 11478 / NBRC 16432 / NCIMB 13614 / HKI 0122) TaxID=471853 RepID=C5C3P1_BEUC1|nr:nucleotide exchange factor GrpE [Beutenbergia cavernae]ACQ81950.1 GrpE protein [Beutenbergia cavernae DSM 12333]